MHNIIVFIHGKDGGSVCVCVCVRVRARACVRACLLVSVGWGRGPDTSQTILIGYSSSASANLPSPIRYWLSLFFSPYLCALKNI